MEASQILTAVTAVLALAEGQKWSDLAVPSGEPPPFATTSRQSGSVEPVRGAGGIWGAEGTLSSQLLQQQGIRAACPPGGRAVRRLRSVAQGPRLLQAGGEKGPKQAVMRAESCIMAPF